MMRKLFYPVFVLFLTACVANVSARSDQGRVAYVQKKGSILAS